MLFGRMTSAVALPRPLPASCAVPPLLKRGCFLPPSRRTAFSCRTGFLSPPLLCPAGPGARQVRRSLFGGDACARILHEHTGGVCLPFVDRYRHLGVIQTHGTGILAELKQRCGSAWGCFRDCRKQVFRSPRLSIERKAAVFHSLIMPRLLYGAGSWPVLSKGEWRLFSSTLTSMCRQLLGLKHTDDQHLAASTIYALARQPAPFVWLFLERLRYLRALVTHGPRPLWALIRNDDGYLEAMRQALAWLFERVRATSGMPCPSSQWDCWVSLMTQQPGRFKSMLRQAKDLEILRASCLGALFELRKQLQACCDQETVFHVKSVFPIDALGRGTLPVSMDTDVSRGFLPGNGHGLVVAGVTAPPIAWYVIGVQSCLQDWGGFQPTALDSDDVPHPQAPPESCSGVFDPMQCVGIEIDFSAPLLEALQQLDPVTDEAAWELVSDTVEPLEILRNTVRRWHAARPQNAPSPDTPENLILLLDPHLICDTFRAPRQPRAEDLESDDIQWPTMGRLRRSPPGRRLTFGLSAPPAVDFGYPFRQSVRVQKGRESLAWIEAACETVGRAVIAASTAPVVLDFPTAAQAFLGPCTSWLHQGGWLSDQDRFWSPTA